MATSFQELLVTFQPKIVLWSIEGPKDTIRKPTKGLKLDSVKNHTLPI